MTSITRRIAATAALFAAPALIALGTATAGHADPSATTTAPPGLPAPDHIPLPDRAGATTTTRTTTATDHRGPRCARMLSSIRRQPSAPRSMLDTPRVRVQHGPKWRRRSIQ